MILVSRLVRPTFSDWPDDLNDAIIFFFVGCRNKCEDCQNDMLADYDKVMSSENITKYPNTNGAYYSFDETSDGIKSFDEFVAKECNAFRTYNVIFEGGDPLSEWNAKFVSDYLMYNSKYAESKKHVCVYTGYSVDIAKNLIKPSTFDYIKCGRFDKNQYQQPGKTEKALTFASKNQQLYNSEFKLLSNNGKYIFPASKEQSV